ncbi:lantibiotic dehydratase [Streptosporangium sp. NPDC051022]|uniref:lantibiotic dehydratase n=1 Tax=Streptosporangium sp. NPDC051022 TaxID=3155752 RepID=UPI0034378359
MTSRGSGDSLGVGDGVVVRVAALPVETLEELRCPDSWEVVRRILEIRSLLILRGRVLAERLGEAMGEVMGATGASKPRLVALRRALHNARRPPSWSAEVVAALDGDLGRVIEAWLGMLDDHDRLTAELPGLLDGEVRERREALRRWAAEPAFGQGLLLASPALSAAARRWLGTPPGTPPPRQIELRLTRYLARVAAKTSPYATFMMSGLARWSPYGEAAAWGALPWSWRGAVEPNVWLLRRLLLALGEVDDRVADESEVRASVSLFEDERRWWVLGANESAYHGVAITEPLAELLRDLREGPYNLGEARLGLARREVLERLVEVGLLERLFPVADQAPRPLDELAGRFAGHGASRALEEAGRALERYPSAESVAERDVLVRRVRSAFGDLAALVTAAGGRPVALPDKNVFYENAVFDTPAVRLGAERWRAATADLHVIRDFLAPFQHHTAARMIAGSVFADRFGPGGQVPFGRFHRLVAGLRGDGAEAELDALLNRRAGSDSGALPRTRELRRIRDGARAALRGHVPGPDGTITVDPASLAKLSAGWPEFVEPVRSLACLVQILQEADPVRLVLNGVAGGYGAMLGRTRRLLGDGPGGGHQADAGVVLAELAGHFGSNLNLRPVAVPYEITYPGSIGSLPPDFQIPLGGLAVRHERDTDRLVLVEAATGRRVRPIYTGMMAAALLPKTARLLLHLFGDLPSATLPTWALFTDLPDVPPESVTAVARVSVGHVVVARASWHAATAAVPRRRPGDTEAGHLLSLAGWFAEHAIPPRCFVFSHEPGAFGDDPWRAARLAKPTYLDLADPALVALFDRQLGGSGTVTVFQEVLPAFTAATDLGPHGHHVTEYVIELSGAADV